MLREVIKDYCEQNNSPIISEMGKKGKEFSRHHKKYSISHVKIKNWVHFV